MLNRHRSLAPALGARAQLWVPSPLHGCAVRVGTELSASQALPCCSQSDPSVSFSEHWGMGATEMTVHWLAVTWVCQGGAQAAPTCSQAGVLKK